MKRIFTICCLLAATITYSQVKIGDNPNTINAKSLLELESTTKGLLLPRMTNTQITAMTGVPKGMLVFSSTDSALYLRRDTGWAILALGTPTAATNKWATSGNDIYSTNSGKVGIGTSTPYSQLSNTPANILGFGGYGGSTGSFAWVTSQIGYTAQMYNSGTSNVSNGLLVKVNSTNSTALDISTGAQGGTATSLLAVNASGKVGIGIGSPTEALDVSGNIKYSGSLLMGVQYASSEISVPANNGAAFEQACPVNTKLIGGGGGYSPLDASLVGIRLSYSGPNNNSWRIVCVNTNSAATDVSVYAICAKVQ